MTGKHVAPWWIPKFLITPTLRLYYLRAVVILSAIVIWYTVWLYLLADRPRSVAIGIVISSFTFAHHLGTALGPRYFPVLNLVDLFLHGCESVCAVYMMAKLLYWKHTFDISVSWYPKRAVFGLTVYCVLTLTLVILLGLKLLDLACSPRRTILRRVNIRHSYINVEESEDSAHPAGSWKYGGGALFGRKPWQEKLPGEASWIRRLRGVTTLAILLVIVFYGAYEVILKPIAEMGMVPNNEYRAFSLPGTFDMSATVVYNVIAVWATHTDAPKTLLEAADVEIFPRLEDPALNACTKSQSDLLNATLGEGFQVVLFECARPIPEHNKTEYDIDDFFDRLYRRPNLQMRVDLTDLMAPDFGVTEEVDLIFDSVQVWLAFTENVDDVTNSTTPIALFPGANLLSVVDFTIKQKLKPGALATLGFDLFNTFIAPNFLYTIPNPYITSASATISTLRIVPALEVGEWVIHEDFRNKSVLNGLSALGGLGSFLSTLLVIVLGSTLMQTVRGKRPYSPFGFFHNIEKEQTRMREECFKRYPGLQNEIIAFAKDGNKRGVVSFLLDTLIDVENLGFKDLPSVMEQHGGHGDGDDGGDSEKGVIRHQH